jgi:cullin 3
MLYNGVKDCIKENLEPVIDKLCGAADDEILNLMHESWRKYTLCMVMIRDILMYLDRTYVSKAKLVPVYEMALKIFKKYIV